MTNVQKFFSTLILGLVPIATTALADELRDFEIAPGFRLSDAPQEIQELLTSREGLTEVEIAQLFIFFSVLGEEISVGGGRPTTCSIFDVNCDPNPQRPLFDATSNLFAFMKTRDEGFGLTQGLALGANGVNYAINNYDVAGVNGFADVIVATPEVTCPMGDLQCIQQGWRDRNPFEQPQYPSRVSCLGAEITDQETIAALYSTIRGSAQEIRQSYVQEYYDSTFSTPADVNELNLSDLAMTEERARRIEQQAQRAPEILSPNSTQKVRDRFDEVEEQRRRSGRVFPTLGYSSEQNGVVFGVSQFTP